MYKGTFLTCLAKGPSSEVDKKGKVRMLVGERKDKVKSIYWGESSFGAYVRGRQHLEALKKPKQHQDNAFVRHREDSHRGEEEEVRFKYEMVRCYNKPLGRLISEGCHILSPEADICMNGKLDHCKPAVGRVVISNTVYSGRRRGRNPG